MAPELELGEHVHLGVGSDEPKISPCGPSESGRFRAERTMPPSAVEAQAPTAMVPLCRAAHA